MKEIEGQIRRDPVRICQSEPSVIGIFRTVFCPCCRKRKHLPLTDADNSLNILRYFTDKPTVVIVKHNNPCGVARSESLCDAYQKAYMADRVAAFGGCIAVNRPVDKATAEAVSNQYEYAEVVVAPDFEEGAMDILARRKNLRVIQIGNIGRLHDFVGKRFVEFKSLTDGGLIAQWSFVPAARSKEDLALAREKNTGSAGTRLSRNMMTCSLAGWWSPGSRQIL